MTLLLNLRQPLVTGVLKPVLLVLCGVTPVAALVLPCLVLQPALLHVSVCLIPHWVHMQVFGSYLSCWDTWLCVSPCPDALCVWLAATLGAGCAHPPCLHIGMLGVIVFDGVARWVVCLPG